MNRKIFIWGCLFLLIVKGSFAQDASLPIGVFDSGTGGLTILNTIIENKELSKEKYIYLADQANMPYGNYFSENKSPLLVELVIKDAQFLLSKNVKTIVIACNTATAYAIKNVREFLEKSGIKLKVIGVIDAGAMGVLSSFSKTENGSIGVFATVGTIASKGYENTILKYRDSLKYTGNIQIYNQGGYGIAEAVDEEPDFISRVSTSPTKNYRGPSFQSAQYKIEKALLDVYDFDFDKNKMLCDNKNTDDCQVMQINSSDNYVRYHVVSLMENIRKTKGALPLKALILGCTHYPYLKNEIKSTLNDLYNYSRNGSYIYRPFMVKDVKIIDPAENVATELYQYLKQEKLFNEHADTSVTEFYITVPNTDNKNIPLDSAGRFTYEYKYGRQEGVERNDVKTVPFSESNIPAETYERFRAVIPSTYKLISSYQKYLAIQEAVPAIDSMYRSYAAKFNSPGMVYGIVSGDKFLHTGTIGYSNIEKKYSAGTQSAFRIASMTKSFVGVAILQLRDIGKLKLDDPAYLYIPELKNQKYITTDAAPITVRNLLTHSAGFPEDNPWGDRQLDISEEEMLSMFKKGISFSNNPGMGYEYSNMGFAMLGYIIKKVSGKPYQQYISENIFKPLGMNHTYWEYSKVPEKQLALGYRYVNDKWVPQPILHDGAYGAMGGLITTLEDFQKYVSFHLSAWPPSNNKESGPLKRSSLREMQKPWQLGVLNANAKYPGGRGCATVSAYGYGLRWLKDCEGRTTVGHSGGLPGYGSNWMILPHYNIGLICFSNITYAPATLMNTHAVDTLITITGLKPNPIALSPILQQRKNELVKLLPEWKDAEAAGIFAENFFLDYFVDSLKKDAREAFRNAGKIISVKEIVPENNLRGTFIIEGEKQNIEIYFTLSPENPPLIQEYDIRNIPKN
jgi:CubicO group peptidase (beta-lactamase class C family)/glutamate racemase